ncbi:hypothetical protein [Actinoallomurus sp. NPDC052274]|uniref:hypothetical protein n=1 Tax=Actinoallomurus sp. NPDC052274 TaxID=3155420 RepID=UPI00341773C8
MDMRSRNNVRVTGRAGGPVLMLAHGFGWDQNRWRATDPDTAAVFARTTFLSDSRKDLAAVSVPTLVLECREDVIAPREVGAYAVTDLLDAFGEGPDDDTAPLAIGVPRGAG